MNAQDDDLTGYGRGGAGNIANTKIFQKQQDDKKGAHDARVAEAARAHATAAAEAIQVPKPTRAQ